uniref:Uncharacterized protein n=1 Tax=Arundo donax TaxID=35708 RepID=A0A0A9EIQ5_ARUDO
MNEDKNLTENPMICIHNASLSEKTNSWPYFSSGVIVHIACEKSINQATSRTTAKKRRTAYVRPSL